MNDEEMKRWVENWEHRVEDAGRMGFVGGIASVVLTALGGFALFSCLSTWDEDAFGSLAGGAISLFFLYGAWRLYRQYVHGRD